VRGDKGLGVFGVQQPPQQGIGRLAVFKRHAAFGIGIQIVRRILLHLARQIGDETKFVCVDGPDFDAHKVDWDNMMMRMGTFKAQEQEDFHKCKLESAIEQKAQS